MLSRHLNFNSALAILCYIVIPLDTSGLPDMYTLNLKVEGAHTEYKMMVGPSDQNTVLTDLMCNHSAICVDQFYKCKSISIHLSAVLLLVHTQNGQSIFQMADISWLL